MSKKKPLFPKPGKIKIALNTFNHRKVEMFAKYSESELLENRNIGIYTIEAIKEALAKKGLSLRQGEKRGKGRPKKPLNKKIKKAITIRPDHIKKIKETGEFASMVIEKALDKYFEK